MSAAPRLLRSEQWRAARRLLLSEQLPARYICLIHETESCRRPLLTATLVADHRLCPSPNHWTALHRACVAGNAEIARILLEHGADPLTEWKGKTAKDLASNEDTRSLFTSVSPPRRPPLPTRTSNTSTGRIPIVLQHVRNGDLVLLARRHPLRLWQ